MNEDEIDISSSSSSSSCSSRSASPTRNKLSSDNKQIDSSLVEDQEICGMESELPAPSSVHQQLIRTEGEIALDELPPVEPLDLKAPLEELDQIGRVSNITGKLVIVISFKGKPPLDLDSVLFLRDCSPLGRIHDTFGPVVNPFYAVRFNSLEEITSRGIRVNSPVYFIPNWPEPLTKYVFYQDLKKLKGSDASWKNDNEPPEELIDYSDDEEERQARKDRKRKVNQDEDDPPIESNDLQRTEGESDISLNTTESIEESQLEIEIEKETLASDVANCSLST
ncbi:H/ACA ribonucleoprotein complex non-core subunit NAF1-like [Panonychus citri]|uniref:H/ACA ribonucleoprotein complex non-core subunit NAF1-like n=1 Tax=Panonychus citri TaxID=50023 RepID=UPI002306F90E|nr:H/ACA ribonucleoprotein complex non-core subunit NAF1-like [Panonychus citri]